MEEERNKVQETADSSEVNIRSVIREAIEEFVGAEKKKSEPAYKTELADERKRREQLERRVNELIDENDRSRRKAEEAERNAAIRDELQQLGVGKVDLGFKAVKDDVYRAEDGRLVAGTGEGEVSLHDYLVQFTKENPELLPARIPGGSGASGAQRSGTPAGGGIDLSKIKPGMDPEERERARRAITEVASQSFRRG